MRKRKIITSVLVVLGGLLFITANTGINILIHDCLRCGEHKVETSFLTPQANHKDDCCHNPEESSSGNRATSFEATSCVLKVEKLKLTNYTTPNQVKLNFTADQAFIHITAGITPPLQENYIMHFFPVYNKHGGRNLVTLNCQLIS